MRHQLGVLPAHEGMLMMLGLGFGQGLAVNQLFEPLGQRDQLVLGGRGGRRRFRLITLAIISQHLRVNPIGFCPLALGSGGSSHLGRVSDRDWNLLLVQDPDQGAFIAPRGFTNDMSARYLLELSAQLAQALSGIAELALPALQVKLKGSFGDIHSGIDNCVFGLHSFDRVRTQPYLYELAVVAAAPATVRVWSTGRARLWLGFGLTKVVRGLHELAHAADHRLHKGVGLMFLLAQEK